MQNESKINDLEKRISELELKVANLLERNQTEREAELALAERGAI